MTKINIISPLDKLYNDAYSILLMYPCLQTQLQLQDILLTVENSSLNIYVYKESQFAHDTFSWLLDVFAICNLVIIDIDQISVHSNIQQILSYMIAKPKTYWLTTHHHTVYNYISNNRVYDLSFLKNIGVFNDKKQ
jgi:hypothetical protein